LKGKTIELVRIAQWGFTGYSQTAGFSGSKNRYSRAIDIRLDFSDGTHQNFTLEDREEVPQNLTLVPVTTTFVKITIMSMQEVAGNLTRKMNTLK
jgi:hypothetical protein